MLQWFIDTASLFAPTGNNMMNIVNLVTGVAFLLTNGALVYCIIRYRRRRDTDETSRLNTHHTIEAIWTIVPSIFFVFFYYIGVRDFVDLRAAQGNARQIHVTARQWAWEFTYPGEDRAPAGAPRTLKSYNILYLEEGRPVKLIMRSKDVIHSFYVPVFRVKEDVLANIYTFEQFVPIISERQRTMREEERRALYALTSEQSMKIPQVKDQCTGYERGSCATYTIFCAEYCGKDHSYMLGSVVVLSKKNYEKKLQEIEQSLGKVGPEEGEKIYTSAGCKSCHSIDGSRVVGPSWKGLWKARVKLSTGQVIVADENYISRSISDPGAQIVDGYPPVMPPQDLSEDQVLSVIEYIKTLK